MHQPWMKDHRTLSVVTARIGALILLCLAGLLAYLAYIASSNDPLWHGIILAGLAMIFLVTALSLVAYREDPDKFAIA